MNDERLRILRLVQEGKISPEDAEKLFAAMDTAEGDATKGENAESKASPGTSARSAGASGRGERRRTIFDGFGSDWGLGAPPPPPPPGGSWSGRRRDDIPLPRTLHIEIESGDDDVHVSIPLAVARVARSLVPNNASAWLEGHDIDLDQILDAARAGATGTLLEIEDGDGEVRIYVE